MADVTLLGASYTDVPAVTLPKTGGGTCTFYEALDGDSMSYGYAPIAGTAVVGSTVLPNIGKVGSAKVGITLV